MLLSKQLWVANDQELEEESSMPKTTNSFATPLALCFSLYFKEPEKWTNDSSAMLVDTSSGNSNQNVLGGQEESEEPGVGDGGREATLEGENQHGESDNTTMLNQNQDEGTSNEVGEQSSEEEFLLPAMRSCLRYPIGMKFRKPCRR
jgi:hypothetical protein